VWLEVTNRRSINVNHRRGSVKFSARRGRDA